ncbi:hypothetical protein As57867_004173, partial [Aphanomyces stellatus]
MSLLPPAALSSPSSEASTSLCPSQALSSTPLIMQPSFANDVWWANYTPSVDQAFVVDLFNDRLALQSSGPLDVLSPNAFLSKSYSSVEYATTEYYPTYARRLVLTELTSIEYAIANLRSIPSSDVVYLSTIYCWVDLNRQFELAHTRARQQRCVDRYSRNGAVYLESVLRNQIWAGFIHAYGDIFSIAIGNWLQTETAGQMWLNTTAIALATTTLAQEEAYWLSHNISYFELLWENEYQPGITETMSIENALGLTQVIELKNTAYAYNYLFTSNVMHWHLDEDLNHLADLNFSLVRSANNSFFASSNFDMQEYVVSSIWPNGSPVYPVQIFQTSVGPFLSVDTIYISIPMALIELIQYFQAVLLNQSTFLSEIPTETLHPVPVAWTDPSFVYYGGNPLCVYGEPLAFVQETFNFYDGCDAQNPIAVTITNYSGLFAVLANGFQFPSDGTSGVDSNYPLRLQTLFQRSNRSIDIPFSLSALVQPAVDSISALNISLMQFASYADGSNAALLLQPLLGDPTWDYFGWIMLFDWVQGSREVVSFQGDLSTLVLISSSDNPQHFVSSAESLKTATRGIYLAVCYSSVILAALALACLACLVSTHFDMHGSNLCWFNRIVSSTWVGRPLIFVRGTSALLMLSTAQMTSAPANVAVRNLNIELIQFGELDYYSYKSLRRINLLDPTQVEFTFFAWSFLVEWALGYREVVRFEGDFGNMTLLSSSFDSMSNSVSAIEYPTDLTFYLRKIVAYVTYAMISVAALVLIFVGLSRGHVEVLNLLELQRVGAIVWIGRPLLFVRSLTAVGLLSTANLALVYNGFVSYFIVTQNPWYKTLLAANEVTWMVAIVNDIAMAFTREHTIYYATINSILVWLATAILGLTTPVQHSATTNKQCSVIQMDFQVVCTSGVVAIGRLSRLALILGM